MNVKMFWNIKRNPLNGLGFFNDNNTSTDEETKLVHPNDPFQPKKVMFFYGESAFQANDKSLLLGYKVHY